MVVKRLFLSGIAAVGLIGLVSADPAYAARAASTHSHPQSSASNAIIVWICSVTQMCGSGIQPDTDGVIHTE